MNIRIATFCLAIVVAALYSSQARHADINFSMSVSEDAPQQLSQDMISLCFQETEIAIMELFQFQPNKFALQRIVDRECLQQCLHERMGLVHDGIFVQQDAVGRITGELERSLKGVAPWARSCYLLQAENKCERTVKLRRCLKSSQQRHMLSYGNGNGSATTNAHGMGTNHESPSPKSSTEHRPSPAAPIDETFKEPIDH